MTEKINSEQFRARLCGIFSGCCDFSVKNIRTKSGDTVYVASISGFCDKKYISSAILRPLTFLSDISDIRSSVTTSHITEISDCDHAADLLTGGSAVVFCDIGGYASAFASDAKSEAGRSVDEPDCEVVIRGPREGFVESGEINVALIRKRLKTKSLRVEKYTVGQNTGTDVFLVYIDGIASRGTVEELRKRLGNIKIPACMDSGYIEQYIGDSKYPLFPDVGNSEKPDKVAAKLIGGRVAVICDGSPCVLTVPYFFVESIQSSEDYLKTPYYATFVRIIRFIGTLTAVFLPALYIALIEYDPSALPKELFMTISSSREHIPFSPFTEILIILTVFEIIREVGVRMPRAVGDAVSIVAGIILGDAAIKAGIASAPAIMVAALSATCSFIDPPFMNALPLVRLITLVFSRVFGIFGIAFILVLTISLLCVKTSFGKPYLSPVSPLSTSGLCDTLFLSPDKALSSNDKESKIIGGGTSAP